MARTLSASAHKKAILAATELVADHGIDATSMDSISQRSGVSKATLYKHWIDKDSLMLDVLAEINGLRERPKFDSGDTKGDLIAVLSYRPEKNASTRDKIMPHFVAYSAHHHAFGQAWRGMVLEPPRNELKNLLAQGVARGELTQEIDFETATALLLGPMMYWLIFLQKRGTPPPKLAEKVVESFWRAWSIKRGVTRRPASGQRARAPGKPL